MVLLLVNQLGKTLNTRDILPDDVLPPEKLARIGVEVSKPRADRTLRYARKRVITRLLRRLVCRTSLKYDEIVLVEQATLLKGLMIVLLAG